MIIFNNYLLFHTLVELTSIAVAWCIFMIAWNTRALAKNACFLTIGVAYLWVGGLDLLHTLSYKGMGLFPGYDANLPTQIWIAARYLESLSLLAALGLMDRSPKGEILMPVYGVVSTAAAAAALGGAFPDCFVEGVGLTRFKIVSEYAICLLLLAAAGLLRRRRAAFDPYVFRLLAASIGLTIGAELAFTFYISVYGLSNLIGHFFKLGSFYLIYLGLVEAGLRNPFSIVFRDLKLSQAALKKSEGQFRRMFETHDAVMLLIDPKTGEIVQANKAAEKFYGYTADAFADISIFEINQSSRSDIQREMAAALSGERNRFWFQHRLADGRVRDVEVHSSPITFHGKRRLFSIVHDITERKRAEEQLQAYSHRLQEMVEARTKELEQAQKELLAKERLAVLGHFAGNVSHELRNPLAAIDSSAYILRLKHEDRDDSVRTHLDRISDNVRKSTAIIESLLNLSRMEKPKTKRTDLTDFLSESLRTVKIPPTVETTLDLPQPSIFVDIDPEQIRMALKNIITNAVQAMDGSGALTIAARPSPAGGVEMSVTDTGPGIAPDHIEKVFEPLFSTKTHGIGFGLSIVRMIVENHGGTIRAEAPADGGACFVITLPQDKLVLAQHD